MRYGVRYGVRYGERYGVRYVVPTRPRSADMPARGDLLKKNDAPFLDHMMLIY